MYRIVHVPAACEALIRNMPDPPQALSVLFLFMAGTFKESPCRYYIIKSLIVLYFSITVSKSADPPMSSSITRS